MTFFSFLRCCFILNVFELVRIRNFNVCIRGLSFEIRSCFRDSVDLNVYHGEVQGVLPRGRFPTWPFSHVKDGLPSTCDIGFRHLVVKVRSAYFFTKAIFGLATCTHERRPRGKTATWETATWTITKIKLGILFGNEEAPRRVGKVGFPCFKDGAEPMHPAPLTPKT